MQPRDLHKPPEPTSPLASCLRGLALLLVLSLAYVALQAQPTEGPSAVYEHARALRPVGGKSQAEAPRSVVAALSAAAAVSARQLVPSPNQTSHISPPPRPPSAPSTTSGCTHVLEPSTCLAWVEARDQSELPVRSGLPPQRPRRCEADCHDRGVCNAETGVCACRAGYNGTACGSLNLRPCNGGKNDGLWHGSHCAGECDELTGFCWCPGRLHMRPMGESCQPVRMPLDVYAALELYTDIWEGTSADGKRVLDSCPAADHAKQQRRKRELDRRVRELRRDPAQRGAVLRQYWASGNGSLLDVSIRSETGVPHATLLPTLVRGEQHPPTPRQPNPDELHFKKPTARGTALRDRGPDAWCGDTPSVKCGCHYDGVYGEACEERHEAFCLNQCSGHGRCDELGGFCHCEPSFFGADCSLTSVRTSGGGRQVALHAAHAAHAAHATHAAPRVYVYELPRMTTLILQYRANGGMCAHRAFDSSNQTKFNGGWVYTSDVEP